MAVRRGYKQTEVGIIPEDWEVKEVFEFATIKTGPFGTLLKASEYSLNDGVPLVSVGEVREGYFHVSKNTPLIPDIVTKRLPQYLLKRGDIVFGRKGGVERSALVREHQVGWFLGSDGICIRANEECHDEYLASQFQSDQIKKWLLQNAIGTTMASLNQSVLGKVVIPFPPTRSEQENIAEALTDTDKLIESMEQLIAKKRQVKQGATLELLTPRNDWETTTIGNIADPNQHWSFTGGPFGSNLKSSDYTDEGIRVIQLQNIGDGQFINDYFVYTSPGKADELLSCNIYPGDILLSKMGNPVARACIVPNFHDRYVMCSDGIRLKIDIKNYNTFFICALINDQDFRTKAENASTGSTRKRIGISELRDLTLSCPSLDEQTAIATILSDMDAEITELGAKLAKARKVKQGMMQELLTGSIRLPFAQGCSALKKSANKPKHNQHFEDAVIIGTLAGEFGTPQYPVSRKRYTKLSYLLHRYHEQDTSAYLKKAAGPYNPTTRYGGAEKIAQKNGYVCQVTGKYKGFVAGENVGQAQEYFLKWYGPDALRWLEQFRYAKSDELELWTTIGAAVQDVRAEGRAETLENVKAVLQGNKEWVKKLERPVFSDENILAAMGKVDDLFK